MPAHGAPSSGLRLADVTAHASSGSAQKANSSNRREYWRSSGVPATLAFDLSKVEATARRRLLLAWYNDATYGYDHRLLGQPGYNNPGSYVVEASADAGGWFGPPEHGWETLATVNDNSLHSREQILDAARFPWLRIRFVAADGSPGNSDIAGHFELFDASGGPVDSWLFVGDSITANGMGHGALSHFDAGDFGAELERRTGRYVPHENAGMPGWTTVDVARVLPRWLESFPGSYVTLAFGTNDAAGGVSPEAFYNQLSSLANLVISAGKTPLIPTIPWAREPYHAARIPALNDQIRRLCKSNPKIIAGPDLFALFSSHPQWISDDGIHPTEEGTAGLRRAWADTAASSVYRSPSGQAQR